MGVSVGQDIYSTCGKCGDVWHVVAAMNEDRVTKVTCKNCMGAHRYKAPPGEVDVNKSAKPKRRAVSTRNRTATKSKVAPSADHPLVEPNMDRPIQEFNIRHTFEAGDRIAHVVFGNGVVESTADEGKMLIFFERNGRKTLAHGRS